MPDWMKQKLESRCWVKFQYPLICRWHHPYGRKEEEELKILLTKVKEESEKAGLKLNIQKTKTITSSPITSWQIDGETVTYFIFLGSKITADGDCSHEIKRCLFLGRKAMTKLDSVLKSRDTSQSFGFPSIHAWIWELGNKEGWTLKNWCFQIVVLENSWEPCGQQRDHTGHS